MPLIPTVFPKNSITCPKYFVKKGSIVSGKDFYRIYSLYNPWEYTSHWDFIVTEGSL